MSLTFVLPIVGEERTPGFLSTKPSQLPNPRLRSPSEASTSSSQGESDGTRPAPYQTSPWNIKRDALLGRRAGGGYLVLMSIGVCVVVLRALGRWGRRTEVISFISSLSNLPSWALLHIYLYVLCLYLSSSFLLSYRDTYFSLF